MKKSASLFKLYVLGWTLILHSDQQLLALAENDSSIISGRELQKNGFDEETDVIGDMMSAERIFTDEIQFREASLSQGVVKTAAVNRQISASVAPTPASRKPTRKPTKAPTRVPSKKTRAPRRPTRAPFAPTRAPRKPTRAPFAPTRIPRIPTRVPTKVPFERTPSPKKPTRVPSRPTKRTKRPEKTDNIIIKPNSPFSLFVPTAVPSPRTTIRQTRFLPTPPPRNTGRTCPTPESPSWQALADSSPLMRKCFQDSDCIGFMPDDGPACCSHPYCICSPVYENYQYDFQCMSF